MITARRRLAAGVALLALVACGAKVDGGGGGRPALPQVEFPGVSVAVEVARTDAERQKGLGGHAPLGERDGMLFVFEQAGLHSFWMKGMTFALDIMWIENERVVHLESDVPPPGPNDSDTSRPIYTPAAPARYVLEVNAGFARRHGITVGTPARLRGV